MATRALRERVLFGHGGVPVLTLLGGAACVALVGERGRANRPTDSSIRGLVARVFARANVGSGIRYAAVWRLDQIASASDGAKHCDHHDPHGNSMGDARAGNNVVDAERRYVAVRGRLTIKSSRRLALALVS